MKISIQYAALVTAIAGASLGAQATPLALNNVTSSVAVVAAPFGGTLLNTAITNISNASFNGVARSAVYDTGSGLDFYYQYANSITSVNGVERFTAFDFRDLNTQVMDVFQTSAAFGIFTTGTEFSDNADRTSLGVVGFSFVPNGNSKINPGTTSYTQIIRTNARHFEVGTFGLIDGIGDNAAAFGVSLVPEPESYALFLSGMGLMAVTKLRRMKNKD
jgi:hypothetical protein